MTNKEFGEKLELRTKDFAIRIIKLSANIPRTDEGRVIKNQISKSGTSVGANYREANRARSAADFRNKIKISESEASETVYWLEIIEKLDWIKNDELQIILSEAKEILALFASIAYGSKKPK